MACVDRPSKNSKKSRTRWNGQQIQQSTQGRALHTHARWGVAPWPIRPRLSGLWNRTLKALAQALAWPPLRERHEFHGDVDPVPSTPLEGSTGRRGPWPVQRLALSSTSRPRRLTHSRVAACTTRACMLVSHCVGTMAKVTPCVRVWMSDRLLYVVLIQRTGTALSSVGKRICASWKLNLLIPRFGTTY